MYLEKENCRIYYEVFGEGEPLLLIHGIVVDAEHYRAAAKLLAKDHRVILYDRRGNSRSRFSGEAHFSVAEQVEDIKDLLDVLGIESADLVGCSAGGVIGSAFLERYPERVRHLLMYEPAMFAVMRDDEELNQWLAEFYDLVARKKTLSAILKLARQINSVDKMSPPKDRETTLREAENFEYAMAVEFPALVDYEPDIEKLKALAPKITLAAGEMSGDTAYVRAPKKLAEILGKELLWFPGYHNLAYDRPAEFAECVKGDGSW